MFRQRKDEGEFTLELQGKTSVVVILDKNFHKQQNRRRRGVHSLGISTIYSPTIVPPNVHRLSVVLVI